MPDESSSDNTETVTLDLPDGPMEAVVPKGLSDEEISQRAKAQYPHLFVPKPPQPGALNPKFDPMAPSREETGGTSPGQALADSARGPAMGAAVAAPMLTGGASLPVQSAVSGLAGAAQSKLEGGSNTEAGISGGIGAALPVVGQAAGKAFKYFSSEGIQNDIKGAIRSLMGKVASEAQPEANTAAAAEWHNGALKMAQEKLPNGTMSEQLQEAAKIQKAGPAAVKAPSSSIRKNIEETADAVYAKSKAIYGQIDAATDGKFQSTTSAMKNIDRKLATIHGVDADQEGALLEQRGQLETAQNKMWDEAKQKGIDPKLVDQAKANYRKAQALYDLDRHLKMSTSGVEPVTPESVDPKKFSTRLERLYDSGRLQEAVGEDGAQDLLGKSHAAEVRQQRLGKFKKGAGMVAKGAATAAGGAALYEGAKVAGAIQ